MSTGKSAACVLAGLGVSLAVLGCVDLTGAPLGLADRPAARAPVAPELRIPAAATAAARDEIPLVPLPLPGGQRPAQVAQEQPQPQKAAPVEQVRAQQPAPPDGPEAVRQLHRRAAERLAGMGSYIARLTRREQVNGADGPEEVLLFRFRRQPWSVYFKWLDGAGAGREVTYVRGCYENKIHTLLAAGDHLLKPAGSRFAVAPDSPLVLMKSRHPITEAGMHASVERLGRVLAAQERGDASLGTLNYLGLQPRQEMGQAAACVEHVVPPGVEKTLPKGGRRLYAFDPASGLPTLVQTRDDRGQEVEYYFYDKLLYPVNLDDADFDPDRLWPKRIAGK
jgi:hypothetical protein